VQDKMMNRRKPWINREPETPQPDAGGWQIVYTGFVLILLCFFIMLTSFASLDHSRITRFVQSFASAVSVLDGGRSLEPGKTVINADAMVVDKEDPIALLFEKVKRLGAQNGLDQVSIQRSERGIVMTLADKTLFQSGEAVLQGASHNLLKKIGMIVNNTHARVDIQGHTDDRPIRTGAFPSNWELSTARAVNVLRYLIAEAGVSPHRLSAVGLSKFHPLVPNNTAENRALNRRVEIIFRPESL
jgi:chemotaxis protein MotB